HQGSAAPPEVLAIRMTVYRSLCLIALALAFIVVVMGAYVRLSDAGLGCPDWPLCYGQPVPADIADRDALAKAWKEMGHRYLAGTLGALILAIAAAAWRRRQSAPLASMLVLLVAFQATLGKWTVTMLLKPAIVTAHLLGGMATLALLAWLALACWPHASAPALRAWRLSRGLAITVAALVALQFALGVLNVALGLPLALAAAHNAGAALLLVSLVVLNFFAFRGLRPSQ